MAGPGRVRGWRVAVVGGALGLVGALLLAAAPWRSVLAGDAPPSPAPAPKPGPGEPGKDAPPEAPPGEACMGCHGDPKEAPKHQVDLKAYVRSVHGARKMDCTECHFDFDFPHGKDAKTVTCAECHEDQAKVVAKSVHGQERKAGSAEPRAATCVDCHGVHDVLRASDPASRLYPLNVPGTCEACHVTTKPFEAAPPAADGRRAAPPSVGDLRDDTHAKALLTDGLTVAPTCVTCHGGHSVAKKGDPSSSVNPANVSRTCGQCHAGILAKYRESVHGMTPRDASKTVNGVEPATCTNCHTPHGIARIGQHFKIGIVQTCSGCHKDRGSTYRGTYHGRVSDLGFGGVASCDECHTAHSILPASDPRSSVHPGASCAKTCAKCHEGATERFATYAVHANPDDKRAWPVLYYARGIMTTVIVATWSLAGLHILLWFLRAMKERKAMQEAHRHLSGRWYQRWPPFYRGLHITVASTFLLLALTGLPLRFHDRAWGTAIYSLLGGPQPVRFLHRLGGAVTFGYFLAYAVHLARRLARGEKGLFRGPNSMIPRWKDVQDIRANFRWFFKGGERPRFDRWTYWEKFDFFAEIWGVGFIGLTGLVMWFPITATSVMPGWAVNLAHILHSYEALLATGFIFSVHFFHANLRPGKFPMDPIIFTGRIPEEELKFERPVEYERMKADGRLERDALPPPDPALVRRAYRVGGTLLGIGLALLLLMLSTLVI